MVQGKRENEKDTKSTCNKSEETSSYNDSVSIFLLNHEYHYEQLVVLIRSYATYTTGVAPHSV